MLNTFLCAWQAACCRHPGPDPFHCYCQLVLTVASREIKFPAKWLLGTPTHTQHTTKSFVFGCASIWIMQKDAGDDVGWTTVPTAVATVLPGTPSTVPALPPSAIGTPSTDTPLPVTASLPRLFRVGLLCLLPLCILVLLLLLLLLLFLVLCLLLLLMLLLCLLLLPFGYQKLLTH